MQKDVKTKVVPKTSCNGKSAISISNANTLILFVLCICIYLLPITIRSASAHQTKCCGCWSAV